MPVDPTHLTSSYDNVDRTSYTTASISPTASRWLVVDIYGSAAAGSAVTPTVSGLSLTWVQELTQLGSFTGVRATRVYTWTGGAPGSGAITVDCGVTTQEGCAWIVYELGADVDTTDPFVQTVAEAPAGSGSPLTVTLAAFASADNRPLICAGHGANEASTPEAGYTEIGDVFGATPDRAFATAFHSTATDTTPSYSWTTGGGRIAIASEIKAAGAGGTDATATPGVIACTAALPAASSSAGATATPTAIATSAALPSASLSGGAGATAAVATIVSTATMPQAAASVLVSVSPATLNALAALPQAQPHAGVTVSPATLLLVASLPTPTALAIVAAALGFATSRTFPTSGGVSATSPRDGATTGTEP